MKKSKQGGREREREKRDMREGEDDRKKREAGEKIELFGITHSTMLLLARLSKHVITYFIKQG